MYYEKMGFIPGIQSWYDKVNQCNPLYLGNKGKNYISTDAKKGEKSIWQKFKFQIHC